jgi:hypothetical protein
VELAGSAGESGQNAGGGFAFAGEIDKFAGGGLNGAGIGASRRLCAGNVRDKNKIHLRGKLEREALCQFRFASQLICCFRCMLPALPDPLSMIRNRVIESKRRAARLPDIVFLISYFVRGAAVPVVGIKNGRRDAT